MSTKKCGMAETRNGGVLISESDSTFVENSHQTFSDVFATSDRVSLTTKFLISGSITVIEGSKPAGERIE